MPITIPAPTRRQFLLAATSALAVGRVAAATDPAERYALLSDTHIDADPANVDRGVRMADHLGRVVAQLTTRTADKPRAVVVTGDCAHVTGLTGDYRELHRLLAPLTAAGYPLHLMLGNHDHRDRLFETFAAQRLPKPPVVQKHVTTVHGRHADWYLLDSLETTDVPHGSLGAEQRAWLAAALDAERTKPAVVVVHHNPTPFLIGKQDIALHDRDALFEVLKPRPRVKAVAFGHTHVWSLQKRDGLHLINLPPVGYVFAQGMPSGFVDAAVTADKLTLTLRALDGHPLGGTVHELAWLR